VLIKITLSSEHEPIDIYELFRGSPIVIGGYQKASGNLGALFAVLLDQLLQLGLNHAIHKSNRLLQVDGKLTERP